MNTKVVQMKLTTKAIDLIDLHSPSPRKKGEFVSQLVEDQLLGRVARDDEAGILERIERRLVKVEQMLTQQGA